MITAMSPGVRANSSASSARKLSMSWSRSAAAAASRSSCRAVKESECVSTQAMGEDCRIAGLQDFPAHLRDMFADDVRPYLADATESRGMRGRADAVALPQTTEEVRQVVAWCYEHDVPIVPRGGGTGY